MKITNRQLLNSSAALTASCDLALPYSVERSSRHGGADQRALYEDEWRRQAGIKRRNVAPELVEEIDIWTKKEGDPPTLKAGVYSADLNHIAHALLARVLREKEEMKIRISELEAKLHG